MVEPCRCVLIVEDDEDIRDAMRDALEDEGYAVATAENGKAALDVLARAAQPPCVMLLDLMMPVMNGWQLLGELQQRSELSRIPVVVVSAADETAPPAGIVRYLRKPVALGPLLETVRAHCLV